MQLTAADLMTTSVITLTPDMTLAEMDTVLVKRGITGAPVVSVRRLVGVASQSDIIRSFWEGQHEAFQLAPYYASPYPIPISALEYAAKNAPGVGQRLAELTVRDVMTTEPLVAHPDDPIEEIAERMSRDRIHRLPITTPDTHDLVGIITTLDLARAISIHGLGSTQKTRG